MWRCERRLSCVKRVDLDPCLRCLAPIYSLYFWDSNTRRISGLALINDHLFCVSSKSQISKARIWISSETFIRIVSTADLAKALADGLYIAKSEFRTRPVPLRSYLAFYNLSILMYLFTHIPSFYTYTRVVISLWANISDVFQPFTGRSPFNSLEIFLKYEICCSHVTSASGVTVMLYVLCGLLALISL